MALQVTQGINDMGQRQAMLQQVQANFHAARVDTPSRAVVADAGYWREANVGEAPAEGTELFPTTNS